MQSFSNWQGLTNEGPPVSREGGETRGERGKERGIEWWLEDVGWEDQEQPHTLWGHQLTGQHHLLQHLLNTQPQLRHT